MPLPPTTYNLKPTRSGFTLVELLVVVAITTVLSTYAVLYSQESGGLITLTVEKAKTGLFIQRAKSLALATRLRDNLERPCGYGVKVDYVANALTLFTYSGVETRPGACGTIGTASPSSDLSEKVVETVGLAQGVRFFQIPPPTDSVPLEQVFFKAPDPTTFLWAGGFTPDVLSEIPGFSAEVTLQWRSGSMREAVRVSNAGEVSF